MPADMELAAGLELPADAITQTFAFVARRGVVPDAKGFSGAMGRVVDGRIDRAGGVSDLERPGEISQVAVLIATGDER